MIVCSATMKLPGSPGFNFEKFRGAGRIDDTDAEAFQRHIGKKMWEFRQFLHRMHDSHGVLPGEEITLKIEPVKEIPKVIGEPEDLLIRMEQAKTTMGILLLCQEMMKMTYIRIGDCVRAMEEKIALEKNAQKPGTLAVAWQYCFGKPAEKPHPLELTLHELGSLERQIAGYLRDLHQSIMRLPSDSTHNVSEEFLRGCKEALERFKKLRVKSGTPSS